ncbi:hypothetical protein RHOSPDRAFT_37009 [Rhodotorula sp. JG-1b]|nr:hypothetical protein RHOSPDRAFT_37009 [Rhodotorula sp. JG-1b]
MLANVHNLLSCGLAVFAFVATANAGKTPDRVFDGDNAMSKIDYSPPFLFPQGGEVWTAGQRYSASWDQDLPNGIPIQNVSQTAKIMLGYKSDDKNDPGLHLQWTLATNVSLYPPAPNSVDFELPVDLVSRDSYLLVLLGSTRNTSPLVSIVGHASAPCSSSTESGSAPSATSSSDASPVAANRRRIVRKSRGSAVQAEE